MQRGRQIVALADRLRRRGRGLRAARERVEQLAIVAGLARGALVERQHAGQLLVGDAGALHQRQRALHVGPALDGGQQRRQAAPARRRVLQLGIGQAEQRLGLARGRGLVAHEALQAVQRLRALARVASERDARDRHRRLAGDLSGVGGALAELQRARGVGELALAQLARPQQEARHQRPVAAAAAAIDDRLDARQRLLAHVQPRGQLAGFAAQLGIVGPHLQRLQRRLDRALALPLLLAQLRDLAVRLRPIFGRGRRRDALLQHHRQRRQLILIAQAHAQPAELGRVAHRLHHRRVHELGRLSLVAARRRQIAQAQQHVDHREAHALRVAAAPERQQRAPGPLGALVVRSVAGGGEQLLQHQRVAEIDRRRLLEHADRLAVTVLRAAHAAELEQDLRALRRAARARQRLLQRRARLIGAAGRQQRGRQREHDRLVLRRETVRALERRHRDRRLAEGAGRQRVDLVGDRDQRGRILGVRRRLGQQRRQRRRCAGAAMQIDERGAHGLRRRRLDQRALEAGDRAVASIDRQVGLRQAQRHLRAIGGGRDLQQLVEPRGRRLGLAALHAQAAERIQRRRRGHQRRRALVRRDGARAIAERALGDAAEPAPQRGGFRRAGSGSRPSRPRRRGRRPAGRCGGSSRARW